MAKPKKKDKTEMLEPIELPQESEDSSDEIGVSLPEEPLPIVEGTLLQNGVIVDKGYQGLAERHYGKEVAARLELSFVESIFLVGTGRLILKKGKSQYSAEQLIAYANEKDQRIREKYVVYRDLRSRGLVVKTGFKFGCDFRVYQRGVGVKRGPKTASEHTKWIVFAVPEDYNCSFQELSRAVRLAHSIRARMLWAVMDNETDVTYYEVVRTRP